MATVTKLHRTDVDDVLDALQDDDLAEILVVGRRRDGEWVTYTNEGLTLETQALGAQLMQAQVMRDCGRMLAPEDVEYD